MHTGDADECESAIPASLKGRSECHKGNGANDDIKVASALEVQNRNGTGFERFRPRTYVGFHSAVGIEFAHSSMFTSVPCSFLYCIWGVSPRSSIQSQ